MQLKELEKTDYECNVIVSGLYECGISSVTHIFGC